MNSIFPVILNSKMEQPKLKVTAKTRGNYPVVKNTRDLRDRSCATEKWWKINRRILILVTLTRQICRPPRSYFVHLYPVSLGKL